MVSSSPLLSPDYLPPLLEAGKTNSDKRLVKTTLLALVAVVLSAGVTWFTNIPKGQPQVAEVTGGTGTVALSLSGPGSVASGAGADIVVNADAGGSHLTAVQAELTYTDTCGTPTIAVGTFLPQEISAGSVGSGKLTFTYGAPLTSGGETGSGAIATIHVTPTAACTLTFTENTKAAVTESTTNALKSASDTTVSLASASTAPSTSPSESPSAPPSEAPSAACPTIQSSSADKDTYAPGDTVTLTCDYGQSLDCVTVAAVPTNLGNLKYVSTTGTKYTFTGAAPTNPGTYTVKCATFATPACAAKNISATCTDTIKTFTVASNNNNTSPTNAPSSPKLIQSCMGTNPVLSLNWTGDPGAGGYTVGIATGNSHGTYYTKPVREGQSTDLTNFVGQSSDVSGKVFTFSLGTTYYAWVNNGKSSNDSTFSVKDCNAAPPAPATSPTPTPTTTPFSSPKPTAKAAKPGTAATPVPFVLNPSPTSSVAPFVMPTFSPEPSGTPIPNTLLQNFAAWVNSIGQFFHDLFTPPVGK